MLKPKFSKDIRKLNRHDISKVIQFCSGHPHLRKHNHNMNKNLPMTCRLCNQGEETPHHLLTDCEPIWAKRQEIFGQAFIDKKRPLAGMDMDQLAKFLRWEKINNLFKTETQEEDIEEQQDESIDLSLQLSDIEESLSSCSDEDSNQYITQE